MNHTNEIVNSKAKKMKHSKTRIIVMLSFSIILVAMVTCFLVINVERRRTLGIVWSLLCLGLGISGIVNAITKIKRDVNTNI
jgi:presenilin-like A22 family membrane protease